MTHDDALRLALVLARKWQDYSQWCDRNKGRPYHHPHPDVFEIADGCSRAVLDLSARCAQMEQVARLFIDVIETADRQREVKSGWGATMPMEPLAYIQPSAFAELQRFARQFRDALPTTAAESK
jgi:hypothetical protein